MSKFGAQVSQARLDSVKNFKVVYRVIIERFSAFSKASFSKLLIILLIILQTGCGVSNGADNENNENDGAVSADGTVSNDGAVSTDETANTADTVNTADASVTLLWSEDYPVYSKDDVRSQIDSGLSSSFEDYQLYTLMENYMYFPDGIRQTIEDTIGAFRLETGLDRHGNISRYFKNYDEENLQYMQAIMDLYALTPDSFLDDRYALSKEELDSLKSSNPIMDMSVYKTPEDGDAFLPYFETFGAQVLGSAMDVTFEGVANIENASGIELIARTIKVTNTSSSYRYVEMEEDYDFSQVAGYSSDLDKRDMIAEADTIGTNGKHLLSPGEVTYYRMDYTGLNDSSFNSHYAYRVYEADEAGNTSGSGEMAAFICTNTPIETVLDTALISGTVYDEDGKVVPFVPVTIGGMDMEGNTRARAVVYTNVDGSFHMDVPVFRYGTDGTWACQAIMVNEKLYYRNSSYGSAYGVAMPTTAGEELCFNLVVPKMQESDYFDYEISSSTDLEYQTYWSDISGGTCATVTFHDTEADKNKVKLHVFGTDGNMIFDYPTGDQVPYVDVSRDGKYIATTLVEGNDQYAAVFDLSGSIIFRQKGQGRVRSIQVSPDNKLVAYGSDEGPVTLADMETGEIIWTFDEQNQVRQLKFDDDGATLFVGSENGVRAVKTESGESLWLTYTESWSFDLIVASDHIYTDSKASGGNANNILCLNKADGSTAWSYAVGSRCCRMALSPDETMLFWGNDTGARDVECYMLDAATGYPLWMEDISGQAAWFTSDSQYVAIKGYGGLFVYDRNGNQKSFLECPANSKMSYFVYISDDLNTILNVAGNADTADNSGMLYKIVRK